MPFVRISLPESLSDQTKQTISACVHSALVKEFDVPPDDFFHVLEELKPSQLLYPKRYLGVDHTDNIVFVQITAAAGRSLERKKRLYATIAQSISVKTEILKSDVIIILTENNGHENWSFGNGEIQPAEHLKNL